MIIFLGRDLSDEQLERVEKLIPKKHTVCAVRSIGYEKLDVADLVVELRRAGADVIVTNERPVEEHLKQHFVPITAIRYRGKDDAVDLVCRIRAAERLNGEDKSSIEPYIMQAMGHEIPRRNIEPLPPPRPGGRHLSL